MPGKQRKITNMSLPPANYSQTAGNRCFLEQLSLNGATNVPHFAAVQAGMDMAATALANGLVLPPPQKGEK